MPIQVLSFDDVIRKLKSPPLASRRGYLAMYSSWLGGIVREPELMSVPIDDHMVHRGDGVFEAIKCVDGGIYCLDRHLERLFRSAEQIGLKAPFNIEEMKGICVETVRAAGASGCLLRLYVSRGPGSFTPNPYDTVGSQMYLVINELRDSLREKYETGVTCKVSGVAVKEGYFANVKSCNYLQNVLMKKDAVDSGVDFTVSRDEKGLIAEGSTENFAIVSKGGEFLVPGFARTLRGVTAVRALELVTGPAFKSIVSGGRNESMTSDDVAGAKEAMFLGTTLDCLPVTTFEGRKIGDGQVGPFVRAMLAALREDMRSGPLVTRV